jgi:hypothetical protein
MSCAACAAHILACPSHPLSHVIYTCSNNADNAGNAVVVAAAAAVLLPSDVQASP